MDEGTSENKHWQYDDHDEQNEEQKDSLWFLVWSTKWTSNKLGVDSECILNSTDKHSHLVSLGLTHSSASHFFNFPVVGFSIPVVSRISCTLNLAAEFSDEVLAIGNGTTVESPTADELGGKAPWKHGYIHNIEQLNFIKTIYPTLQTTLPTAQYLGDRANPPLPTSMLD